MQNLAPKVANPKTERKRSEPIHTSAPADTESAEAQTSDAAAYIAAGLLSTANTPPEAD